MSTATAGLSGSNTLIGTDGSNKIIAGAGNDYIDGGGGGDFINAGGGDDIIVYYETDYKILGGGGIDTLLFKGTNQKLNLAGNVVNGIERLWLDGGGGHQVWFTAADIIRVSDTDQMIITGDSSNRIYPGSGWSFAGLTSDGSSQVLVNGGATLIVSLPVFVEGFSSNASFTVNGPNALTEDSQPWSSQLLARGQLIVNDINAGQGLLLGGGTQTMSKTGTLTITPDPAGASGGQNSYLYSYGIANADDKVQSLGAGKTLTESFTITTIDGSSMQLVFVITGVNDRAEIGAPTQASVTEDDNVTDGYLVASGVLSITDVDTGEAGFRTTVVSAAGNLGTLTMAADGRYTYSVSNASVQYLNTGASKTDIFTVTSLDGTTKDISFTINGVNDFEFDTSPLTRTITEYTDGSVEEASNKLHEISGNLSASGGQFLKAEPGENNQPYLGNFSAVQKSDGTIEWKFDVQDKYLDYLLEGETVTQEFTIIVTDGTNTFSKVITINLTGTKDAGEVIGSADSDAFSGMLDFQIIRGLGGADDFAVIGTSLRVYGDEGRDSFAFSIVTNSIIRGGDDNDRFTLASGAIGNEIFGDNGDDTFIFILNYGKNEVWGGPGADTYVIRSTRGVDTPLIHDFDIRSPDEGGDKIDLSWIGIRSISALQLTTSATDSNIKILSSDRPLLSFVGANLTLNDFADNFVFA